MANEHDITKLMLETMRAKSSNHKSLIVENEQNIIDVDAGQRKAEEEKFMKIVTPAVEFNEFKVDPISKNVKFSGQLNNGVVWSFSTRDGLYFQAPNMELNDELVETLKDMNAHFVNWQKDWSGKLNTEYGGNQE